MFHDKHFTAGQFFVTKKEFYVISKIFIRFLFSFSLSRRVDALASTEPGRSAVCRIFASRILPVCRVACRVG